MIQSIKRLITMAGAYRKKMYTSVLSAIISVAAGLLSYFLVWRFVIELLHPSPEYWVLLVLAACVGTALTIKTILFAVSTMLAHQAAYQILHNVRLRLTEKLLRFPMGYVLDRNTGVIKKVMENDVEELERFLAHNIPETISSIAVPLTVLAYLFYVDWRLTLAMLIFLPLAVLFYLMMMRSSGEKMRRYYESVDRMNAMTVEYVNGMKEIRAFNRMKSAFSKFQNAASDYRRYVLDWYKACWPLMSAYYVLVQATVTGLLPIGLYLMKTGDLELSTLVLFLIVATGFAPPLMKLAEFADGISLVVNAEQNVNSLLKEEELPVSEESEEPRGNAITFRDVTFSYNGKAKALDSVSFIAKEGRRMAIVGPSGSGKSTIAKLICRFWDVSGGSIEVGGVDVRNISPKRLMECIGFVFQDTFLFNLSIAENIRLGKPDATFEEVVEAAKKSQCHAFINAMPDRYDTLAGNAGLRLSGGERQRICIARAILRDAPILVLDEATASIDPDSEEQIQAAIGELAKGKTLIVIAHRIRTVMGFDDILVMQEGKCRAFGSHQELLDSSPEYNEIFEAYKHTENWVLRGSEKPC